jgi:hypothetical protein
MCRLAIPLIALLLVACSDGDKPPGLPADSGPREARPTEFKPPWDGFDPQCPMGGPCVLSLTGEGKHKEAFVVIGEKVILTGKNLAGVDGCYFGAVLGPVISASPTMAICRVPPGAPAGGAQAIEVKAGTERRKPSINVVVRRLLAVLEGGSTALATFEASTHNGGPTVALPQALTGALRASSTGRYLFGVAGDKLLIVDLAAETAQLVTAVGSGDTILSYTPAGDDGSVLVAGTPSAKLYRLDLAGGTAPVSAAPTTSAVVELDAGGGQLAGLHLAAASGEGSVWHSDAALSSFPWADSGGSPFRIGSGTVTAALSIDARKSGLGLLVTEGGGTRLAGLTLAASKLSTVGTATVAGATMVRVSAGGNYLLVGGDAPQVGLTVAALGGTTLTPQLVALGAAGEQTKPFALPTRIGLAAVLVGPAASATSVELVDLTTAKRLTTSSGKPALELSSLYAAVADPVDDVVHVVSGETLKSFAFTVSGTTVTVTEKPPSMVLEKGKVVESLAVQP